MTDLINHLPSSEEDRKKLKNYVRVIADQLEIIDSAKEGISGEKAAAKEEGFSPAWVGMMAKIEFEKRQSEKKSQEKAEETLEIIAEHEILFKD